MLSVGRKAWVALNGVGWSRGAAQEALGKGGSQDPPE